MKMSALLVSLSVLAVSFSASAKVVDPAPVAPSTSQIELLKELEEIDENVEFDTDDDLFINTAEDAEMEEDMERIALESDVKKTEAKAPATTTKKQ